MHLPPHSPAPAPNAPKTTESPTPGPHRVPVVPVQERPTEEHSHLFAQNLGILFFVLAVGLGGWYYWAHRAPAQPDSVASVAQVNDVRLVADAPSSVMTHEEARLTVALTNSSPFERTLGVGIIDDGVFEASGARRIITLGSRASETISLPFSGNAHGSWNLRIGIYDDHGTLIATSSQPVAFVEPALRVSFDMGEKAGIRVPNSGRIYAMVRWQAAQTQKPVNASVHITGATDRTVVLGNLRPGARGSFTVWATLPTHLRGKTVLLEDLNLHARTTWTDIDGVERATRVSPSNSRVLMSAWPRLTDSQGKRISSGPMPLRAGMSSTFWINLSLGRETRDTVTVLAVAKLAPGVEFTGKTWTNHRERISFDKTDRAIVWETHPLRKTDSNEPMAGFEVRFTPSADSVGTLPVLLESIIADRMPLKRQVLSSENLALHDFVSGPVVADFRFDTFSAAENGVRK